MADEVFETREAGSSEDLEYDQPKPAARPQNSLPPRKKGSPAREQSLPPRAESDSKAMDSSGHEGELRGEDGHGELSEAAAGEERSGSGIKPQGGFGESLKLEQKEPVSERIEQAKAMKAEQEARQALENARQAELRTLELAAEVRLQESATRRAEAEHQAAIEKANAEAELARIRLESARTEVETAARLAEASVRQARRTSEAESERAEASVRQAEAEAELARTQVAQALQEVQDRAEQRKGATLKQRVALGARVTAGLGGVVLLVMGGADAAIDCFLAPETFFGATGIALLTLGATGGEKKTKKEEQNSSGSES